MKPRIPRSRWRVGWSRDLGEIVGVAPRVVDHRRHDGPVRDAVAPESIGDESARYVATAFQQPAEKPRGGLAIQTRLRQDIDDLALLVDGPPEVLALAADRHEQFIEMPGVADRAGAPAEASCVGRAESLAPVPDRLVRDGDTTLSQEILDVAEAQSEPVVQPDRVADDRGGEAVPGLLCPLSPEVDNTIVTTSCYACGYIGA